MCNIPSFEPWLEYEGCVTIIRHQAPMCLISWLSKSDLICISFFRSCLFMNKSFSVLFIVTVTFLIVFGLLTTLLWFSFQVFFLLDSMEPLKLNFCIYTKDFSASIYKELQWETFLVFVLFFPQFMYIYFFNAHTKGHFFFFLICGLLSVFLSFLLKICKNIQLHAAMM